MKQYLAMLEHVLNNGTVKEDRTGTGTLSVFGYQSRYDLSKGFPAMTTKRLFMRGVTHELLWFLAGDTNTKYLTDNGVNIWNEWQDENGDLGPVYGKQWVAWEAPDGSTINQFANVVESIKTNPDSRRNLVVTWNPSDISKMALPPCHGLVINFYVANGKLSCQMYQRSADIFLGVPFNIASYALLTHMIAQVCDLEVGDFVHTIGDLHLYSNHIEQAKEQLSRECYDLPTLELNLDVKSIFDFKYEDVKLVGYKCHPTIKAPVAV